MYSIPVRVLLVSLLLLLAGCVGNRPEQADHPVISPAVNPPPATKPVEPVPQSVTDPEPVYPEVPTATGALSAIEKRQRSTPPVKIHRYDWEAAMKRLLASMRKQGVDTTQGTLQVSRFSNHAGGVINQEKGHVVMVSTLSNNTKFSILTAEKMQAARQSLGLSGNDTLQTRRKALAVSRKLNADYMLYSTIRGNISQPVMSISIIGVADGLILFTSKIPLKEKPRKL